jgi:hypothetical protein
MRKRVVFGVMALFFMAFLGCEKEKVIETVPQNAGSISGKAMLEGKNTGNAGIAVYIEGTSFVSFTDDGGNFLISNVPEGKYKLIAQKEGYEPAVQEDVLVKAGQVTTGIVLNLSKKVVPSGSISGKITFEGQSTGNAGIIVFLLGTNYMTTTQDDGSFELKGIPVGKYTLMAIASGYTSARVDNVLVEENGVTVIPQINLQRSAIGPGGEEYGGIAGRVTLNGAGSGNGDIAVFIVGTSYVAYTADDGSYTITHVPPGTYDVRAVKDGYNPAQVNGVTVVKNQITGGVDMNLIPLPGPSPDKGVVVGRVTLNGSQSGNSGVVVFLQGTSHSAYTSDNGEYKISGVEPGTYTLTAYKVGYTTESKEVVVKAGETTDAGTINLLPVGGAGNQPPYVTSTPVTSVYEDDLYAYQVEAQDPENDPINFSLVVFPQGMTMTQDGLITWYPHFKDTFESHPVVVCVADNSGNSIYHIYQVNVLSRWKNYRTIDGLLSNNIKGVFIDSSKEIWAYSYDGISVISQDGSVRNYTVKSTGKSVKAENVEHPDYGTGEIIPAGNIESWGYYFDEYNWTYHYTITDTTKNWEPNSLTDRGICVKNLEEWYNGGWRCFPIESNTSNSITFRTRWYFGSFYDTRFYFSYYVYEWGCDIWECGVEIEIRDTSQNWTPGSLRGRMLGRWDYPWWDYPYGYILDNSADTIKGYIYENYYLNESQIDYELTPQITVLYDPSASFQTDELVGSGDGFTVLQNSSNTLTVYGRVYEGATYLLNTGLGGYVNSITEVNGQKYIATSGGLSHFDGTNWKNYNTLNTAIYGNITEVSYGINSTITGVYREYGWGYQSVIEDDTKNFPLCCTGNYILIENGYYTIASAETTRIYISERLPIASNPDLGFPKPDDTYHFTLDNTITIKDTTKSFQPNELAGKEIFINGYTFKIISNTQNTIKFKVPKNYFSRGSRPIKAGDRYFVLKGLPSNGVNDVDYDPSSSALYIATSNGISIKQGSNWYLRNVKNTSSSYISGEITAVGCCDYIEDSSRNWIPDEHKGKWVETDSGSWCYIVGNDNTTLWVECDRSLLNSTTYTIYSTDGLKSNTIGEIQKKPSGMWVYYYSPFDDIISFFNGFSWTSYEVQNTMCGSPYVYVYNLYEDSNGLLWLALLDEYWYWYECGLTTFDGTNWTTYTVENTESSTGKRDGLGSNYVWGICEDVDSDIWIATYSEDWEGDVEFPSQGGVTRYKNNGWRRYSSYVKTGAYEDGNSGLISNNVRACYVDSEGKKCFATNKGLSCYTGD